MQVPKKGMQDVLKDERIEMMALDPEAVPLPAVAEDGYAVWKYA
jgi:hypothetical protein